MSRLPPRKPSFPSPRMGKSLPPPKKKDALVTPVELEVKGTSSLVAPDSGVCVVCSGVVSEKFLVVEEGTRHSMKRIGIYCERCGLKYEFIPPKLTKKTR